MANEYNRPSSPRPTGGALARSLVNRLARGMKAMSRAALLIAWLWVAAGLASISPAGAVVGAAENGARFANEIVMVLNRGGDKAGFCSGVVLSPRVVLTAAHCLRAAQDMLIHYRDEAG